MSHVWYLHLINTYYSEMCKNEKHVVLQTENQNDYVLI